MDKEKLLQLLHKKIYWEKERDKCFAWFFGTFFFQLTISIRTFSDRSFLFSEKTKPKTTSFDIFFFILDLIILSFYLFFLFFSIFTYFRIEKYSKKLAKINQRLLKEIDKVPKN